jgi:hypothetical protein
VSELGMRNSQAIHVDFGFFKGAIPSHPFITPSNIDMILETNNHILLGEWKRDGEEISKGQKVLLQRLSLLPKFTILVIYGYSNDKERHIDNFYKLDNDILRKQGNGEKELKEYINNWFIKVNEDRQYIFNRPAV